jgi:hypothetical protein
MSTAADAMSAGRRADSARRRQRVLAAIAETATSGEEITVTGIAQRAGVDRSFLYRHRDLLAQIHASESHTPDPSSASSTVSRSSLQTDLLNAQHRSVRLAAQVHQLEQRLSEALGERVWRESGLGAPDDIDQLGRRITFLEQEGVDLRLQLQERSQDLDAARAANRELMTQLNRVRSTA